MSGTVGPRIPPFINTYSLDFDGMDDYIQTAASTSGDITLAGWVDCNGTYTAWQAVFPLSVRVSNTGVPNETLGRLYKQGANLWVILQMYDQNGANFSTYSAQGVSLEGAGWKHLLWTYNNTTKHIYLYINGIAQTWTHYGGVITTPYLTAVPTHLYNSTLFMGAYNTLGGFPFNGNVDEVCLFDRIVTPTEITTLSTSPTVDLTSLNPLAWYRNGDNGSWKSPQWLIPSNENKDKVSNYSMAFDGVNDYINLGSSSTVADGGQFSLSFWIKGNTQPIGAKYLFSADYYNLHTFWTIQNTELYWRNVNNNYKLLSTNLLDGEWHHILIIWNPDGANSTIRCFTDGVNEVNIATDFRYAPGWNGGAYQGGLQYIGNRGGGTFPGFNGSIDEFAVWDNDQSSNILSIYNGGTPTTISGAVAHYKMGEEATFSGGVWTVPDQIGSNDGTSANMTIEDRVGTAPGSVNNALSFNMDLIDRVEDTPPTP